MNWSKIVHLRTIWGAVAFVSLLTVSCNYTRNVPEGKYLLRANAIKLKATVPVTQKGEIKSNLEKLVAQKPNTFTLGIPIKLVRYNSNYEKFKNDPNNYQIKSKAVEPPVVYDSTLKKKSAFNTRSYLFNKGFFYATVKDTTTFRGKKAFVYYTVETGTNYLINNVSLDVDNKVTLDLLTGIMDQTVMKTGDDFSYDLCEQEKSRLTNYLRDYGYYNFTTENISFVLDTFNKQYFNDVENPFESAVNFIAFQKNRKKPSLDIKIVVRNDEDGNGYKRFGISVLRVLPDFQTNKDYRDTVNMIVRRKEGVLFKYHKRYVNENVLLRHMLVMPTRYYSQMEHDQTLSKLNELGVFSSVRITYRPDTSMHDGDWLIGNIIMSPADRFNYGTSWEFSNGTTYFAGTNLTVSFRNNNFGKGANLLTTSINGGLEYSHDTGSAPFFDRFSLLTRSVGANMSLDMPKFLFPLKQSEISSNNTPRTIFSIGANLLDRVNYFTLLNTSTSFQYKWKETRVRTWEIAPVFINNIYVSNISDSFQKRLDASQFLRNSYSSTFIEGENIAVTISDKEKKHGVNYNYLRLAVEEAGGIMKGLNSLIPSLDSLKYAQYIKFDVDAQHFFTFEHSLVAARFVAGVGLPYDKSPTLPYIKQYFVGGPYSLRGFRIRTLGPGRYISPASSLTAAGIDRIGDIKLEMTTEYRFDMIKLFSGAIKMNGAVFADAGNIWLAKKSDDYANGELNASQFLGDVAIDAGVGIRLDLSGFFIFRIDLGFPIKKPEYYSSVADAENAKDYFYGKNGWTLSKIDPLYNKWRQNEMVLNFAIGYPF